MQEPPSGAAVRLHRIVKQHERMKLIEAKKLPLGLYRVTWKESRGGGTSLASVGRTNNGTPWLAPTNWITVLTSDEKAASVWRDVEHMQILHAA